MVFAVAHKKFTGPLDFLLSEIEKKKLSINEIALSQITDSFLNYLKTLPPRYHHELAEFLVIASQLLLIKSRSLLPAMPLSDEEELSIEELENRLKMLQKIREVMDEMTTLLAKKTFLRERESFLGVGAVFYPPPKLTLNDLAEIFREVLAAIPRQPSLPKNEIKKIISLEEKITELQERMAQHAVRLFSEIVRGTTDKTEIIVSFLAILELARKHIIDLQQHQRFGDISITKQSDAK